MNTEEYYKYYTQFITENNLQKVDTKIVKGFLDIKKKDIPIRVFHFLPRNITNKINKCIKVNLEIQSIDTYTVIHDMNSQYFVNDTKLNVITYTDWKGFQFDFLKKYFKEDTINVFLFDSVILDVRDTERLLSLEENDLVILSSKKFRRNEFIVNPQDYDLNTTYNYDPDNIAGLAVLGSINKDVFLKYYLNYFGSKQLFIKSFFDQGYNIVNASNIIRTYLIEENSDYSKINSYLKSPIFTLFIVIPQDLSNEDVLILKDFDSQYSTDTVVENYTDFVNNIKNIIIEDKDDFLKKESFTSFEYKLNSYLKYIYNTKLKSIDQLIETEKNKRIKDLELEIIERYAQKEEEILKNGSNKSLELENLDSMIEEKKNELEALQKEFKAVKYRVDLYEVQKIRSLDEVIASKQEELNVLNSNFLIEKEKIEERIKHFKHEELNCIVNIKTFEASVNETKETCDKIKERIRIETNESIEGFKKDRELAQLELQASVNNLALKKEEIVKKINEEYGIFENKKREIQRNLNDEYIKLKIEKQKEIDQYRTKKEIELEDELKKITDESMQKIRDNLTIRQKEYDMEFLKYKNEFEARERRLIEREVRNELNQYYVESVSVMEKNIDKERTERINAIYEDIKNLKLSKLRELTIWESKHRHGILKQANAYERELRAKYSELINKEYDSGLIRINKMLETQEIVIQEQVQNKVLEATKEETEKMNKMLSDKYLFLNKKIYDDIEDNKKAYNEKLNLEFDYEKQKTEQRIKLYEEKLKEDIKLRIDEFEKHEIAVALHAREGTINRQLEQLYKTKELVMLDKINQKTEELNIEYNRVISEHSSKLMSKKDDLTFEYQMDLETRYKQLLSTFETNKNEYYKKLSIEYQKMDDDMRYKFNTQRDEKQKEIDTELEKYKESYEKKVEEIRVELEILYEKELNKTKKKISDEAQRMRMVIKTLQDTELAEEAKQVREMNLVKTNEECERIMNSVKIKFNEREKLYQEIFDKQQIEIEQANIKKIEEERKRIKNILNEERLQESQKMMTDLTTEITNKRNQMMNDLTKEITEFRKNKVDKINRELFEWVETTRKSKLEEIEESLYSIALQNIQEKIAAKQKEMMSNI